jgi:selenocysteine lyase/cysteine desulfurase
MSTAARIFESQLQHGDSVLVLAEEFPSTVLTWRRAAQTSGATLRTVPIPGEDSNWTRAILDRMDATTKVVSISTCHWTNGARIDIAAIAHACRQTGCVLIIDSSQSLGAAPFSVDDVQPDFLIAAGYKWLLCPYGSSLMYVAERWRNARPLEECWQARLGAEDFSRLARYSDIYMPGARRFDVGEKGCNNVLPGSIAALQQLKAWGIENISAALAEINQRIAQCLLDLDCRIPADTERMPHMFGATLPATYRGNLVSELRDRNIFISQRGQSLRFSPYLHVAEHDIERLLSALRELLR